MNPTINNFLVGKATFMTNSSIISRIIKNVIPCLIGLRNIEQMPIIKLVPLYSYRTVQFLIRRVVYFTFLLLYSPEEPCNGLSIKFIYFNPSSFIFSFTLSFYP